MFSRCGLVSLLLVADFAHAAPVPKAIKRTPTVVLTLTPDDGLPDGIRVTVTNNTAAVVSWQSSTIPLARIGIGITDEKEKPLNIIHPSSLSPPRDFPGREYTVQPGEKYEMLFSLSSCFPNGDRPKGKLTMTVVFDYEGKRYLSEPLAVGE